MENEQNVERIRSIIAAAAQRYLIKGGDVQLAAIEEGTVQISPSGFCWR